MTFFLSFPGIGYNKILGLTKLNYMSQLYSRPEHVFEEKGRIGKLSQIRELVFGSQDGLLVPLGLYQLLQGCLKI